RPAASPRDDAIGSLPGPSAPRKWMLLEVAHGGRRAARRSADPEWGDAMSADNARAAIEAIEAWNDDARERHRSYFADDAVLREHGTGREVHGGDAIVDVHWGWRQSFPDGHGTIGTIVDGGDHVAIEVVW